MAGRWAPGGHQPFISWLPDFIGDGSSRIPGHTGAHVLYRAVMGLSFMWGLDIFYIFTRDVVLGI